jgi:lipoprotein-releasing system permease protein
LQARLAKIPGVVATTPFLEGPVMVIYKLRPQFPAMQGIDVARVSSVIPLEKYITFGSLAQLDDDSIILSKILAGSLGAQIGDKVEVYSPLAYEKFKRDDIVLPRELRVVGFFEFGHQALDSSVVLVTLRAMQDLYGFGGAVHGINIKITPGLDADLVAERINAAFPPEMHLHARSWIEINQDFLFVLQFERNMMFFLLMFIVVVAAFSVTSSLLISVIRKTREIGLLGALGAKPWQVAACFCFQGFFIGVCGTIIGLGLGFGVKMARDDIIEVFTRLTQSKAALLRFYQFSHLPWYTDPAYLAATVIGTIMVSTLAGLLPAWRAAKLKPVEALRSE